jgi:hypothetical protein
MSRRIVCLFAVVYFALSAAQVFAQPAPIARYLKGATPIATAPLTFPGPYGGYMFVHLPVEHISADGDTTVRTKAFLVDLNISHDGIFLSPDTLERTSDAVPFLFPLSATRAIHARLAHTHTHENFRGYDSSYAGSLGFGLLQKYITVIDFKTNALTFYPLLSPIDVPDNDSRVLKLPLIDDAFLTYCHCAYSTIWLDVTAPPLRPGHVQLATQEPISQVFEDALDSSTRAALNKEAEPNSLGQKQKVGLNVGSFRIGGRNIASFGAHRAVDPMPDAFKDLSVTILGTLGNDVLRKFSGIIIDPTRQSLYFVR